MLNRSLYEATTSDENRYSLDDLSLSSNHYCPWWGLIGFGIAVVKSVLSQHTRLFTGN